jgi:UDP-N-acetylmuramate: L-alanyl-gamma-D-glutamyl-meso-diaminopimelate ligase
LKRLHFIAIGGAAMHNLAIALRGKGYRISGSDDEIFEPSLSRLKSANLLPEINGWHPEKIHKDIDAVILGMHARADNPELIRAKELGLKIFSYPEFLYEQTKNKIRVVIAGSHGKTTITAIIIHALTRSGWKIDFMVGSQIEGFDTMVSLNDIADIAVFEGDEYLSSPVDLRPKFIHYKPHIALISGISWDHINVFPSFQKYISQFEILTQLIEKKGHLVYYSGDKNTGKIAAGSPGYISKHPYIEHPARINGDVTYLTWDKQEIPLKIFGRHNLQNINGARIVCKLLGLKDEEFYRAVSTFPGTSKRLQKLVSTADFNCFLDFAHAPSKVRATVEAVKEQYPGKRIIAVLELHTYSSLNRKFIPQYRGTLDLADEAVVFFDRHVLENKKMDDLSTDFITACFDKDATRVFTNKKDMAAFITRIGKQNTVLLLMSSGNFGGINFKELLS